MTPAPESSPEPSTPTAARARLQAQFRRLGNNQPQHISVPGSLDYLMALFSQVAYAPTRFEAGNARKTSVVPSLFFRRQAARGRSVDIANLMRRALPEEETVVVRVTTGNSVTTLTRLRHAVIIASRGTALFHEMMHPFRDAAIDLNAWHIGYGPAGCRYHFGFLEEACASLPHIRAAYETVCGGMHGLPIYFTGHSLGGALSAITDRLWEEAWPSERRTAIVFGCPRFGNQDAVDLRALRSLERKGDPVPKLPPKFLGYASANSRVSITGPDRISRVRLHKNHGMERYRRAVAERDGILEYDALLYRLLEVAVAYPTIDDLFR